MQFVANKLLVKGIKNIEKNLQDPNLTPEMIKMLQTRSKNPNVRRHLNDDEKILDLNSRSV